MYSLSKTKSKFKISSEVPIIGFQIKINKNVVNIINQDIIDNVIEYKYSKELDKILNKILIFLDDEDSDPNSAVLYLDELAKVREILIEKYGRYISNNLKNKFMHKIRISANELKKRCNKLININRIRRTR